jgi:hypothetical protein
VPDLSPSEQESLCDMYRDGVALRTLEIAFGATTEQVIEVLERNQVVQPEPGESREAFLSRIREDVKHGVGEDAA